MPCSLVEVYLRFNGARCLHYQDALMLEAVSNNPENSHIRHRENLKLHVPVCSIKNR
jgi:hypothetical protein